MKKIKKIEKAEQKKWEWKERGKQKENQARRFNVSSYDWNKI